MKRRIGRGLLIVLLATITLFLPLLVSSHRIDEEHRNLIRTGMTAAEVESIFGAPAGTYDWAVMDDALRLARYRELIFLAHMVALDADKELSGAAESRAAAKRGYLALGDGAIVVADHTQTWTSRHGSVTIGFDDAGRVRWVSGWLKTRVEPPWKKWWDKILGK
jgi:hypothetical protein